MNSTKQQSQTPGAVARQIMSRIDQLAELSESTEGLTRRFATTQHRAANDLVGQWMQDCGMQVREDDIGNIIGRYEADSVNAKAKAIMIGSHLDTVVTAGRFDGMLGVLCGLAVVESLQQRQLRLPLAIEVVGFADEEGVRYQSTYLGSKAICGDFPMSNLDLVDADDITMRDALITFGKDPERIPDAARPASEIANFLEVHIEQGPVLERENLPLAVVTSIVGATRMRVTLHGEAGHAGTVPMNLRQDALCAAAEAITGIEKVCSEQEELVGTVGSITALPGASNVIPGEVSFSVDIRAASNERRQQSVEQIQQQIRQAASSRQVEAKIEVLHDEASVDLDPSLATLLHASIEEQFGQCLRLPSGAGHDAAAMAQLTSTGMLFVRCKGGVSHNPAEFVNLEDIDAAASALTVAVERLAVSRV